jgi:hypothetical protein
LAPHGPYCQILYPKTIPERFSVPKVSDWRRELAIVNPIAEYHVSKLIADNWVQIDKHLKSASFGVEELSIKFDQDRAVGAPDFRLVSVRHAEISAIHNYVVTADISRFYGTLYTHVIPWALHTKSWSKAHLNTPPYNRSLGAKLDRAVRRGNDNQTMGIPVGPDSSRILSEIVAVAIDTRVKDALQLEPESIVRNVDDWYIGFDGAGPAEDAISVLVSAAREFELEIHPEKTKVIHVPADVQPVWPSALRQIVVSSLRREQSRTIDYYFSQAFQFSATYRDQNVLRFAVRRLGSVNIFRDNWHQVETYLLKAVRTNATCISLVAPLIADHDRRRYPVSRDRVRKLIKDILLKSGPLGAHYEIVWVLFLAKSLRITLPAEWLQSVTSLESSACALVALDLLHQGLIDGQLDLAFWTQFLTSDGLESNMWLLAYEADLKGWLTPPVAGFVQAHSHFAELSRRNVYFYDQAKLMPSPRQLRPRGPSEAFLRHMAAYRAQPVDLGDFEQVLLEAWELPGGYDF